MSNRNCVNHRDQLRPVLQELFCSMNDEGSQPTVPPIDLPSELRNRFESSELQHEGGGEGPDMRGISGGLTLPQEVCDIRISLEKKLQHRHAALLYIAVSHGDSSAVRRLAALNPELARYVEPRRGWTPLHLACSRGSSPLSIIETLVEVFPQAVNTRTRYRHHHDTPVHFQARNSQARSAKMAALLPHADLRITNRLGHNALHIACGNNAVIDVLQALIEKDQALLDVRDEHGQTPLHVLWEGFKQSIPGVLAVARILNGDTTQISPSFRRFWDKVKLLVTRGRGEEDILLGHEMVDTGVPPSMLQVALGFEPHLADRPDSDGNYLLHKVLLCQFPSFHRHLLALAPNDECMHAKNKAGDTVLTIAIKKMMIAFISEIITVAPTLLTKKDEETKMYPFQLAALHDCPIEVIYTLLLGRPDVIHHL